MTNTYAAAGTVDARLDYKQINREGDEAGALRSVQEYVITVPHDTVLSDDMRIVMNGGTYEVTSVLTEAPWDLCERAKLQRIR